MKTDPAAFNRFFANISFSPSKPIIFTSCVGNSEDLLEDNSQVTCTEFEIAKALSAVSNTAPGLDGVPAWVFRQCSVELAQSVSCIFNQSILNGKIPSTWSTAIVTPVPKIKKPVAVTDYRPISVTPILSRILESIVVKKYLQPSLPRDVIIDQYAYKATGSTTCALVDLMHYVTRSLESCKYVRCIMIDFSRAFDTVDRCILLRKLDLLECSHNVKMWIANFLSGRYQMVSCNGMLSSELPVNQGVVQGSALGPTLFSIMVSDLKPVSGSNKLVKFADDLTLLVPESTETDIAVEFNAVKSWASANEMVINYAKTREMVFHRPKPGQLILPPPLEGIERVVINKLLGVTLACNFSFSVHVDFIIKQCSQRSFILRSLKRRGLNAAALESVFTGLILSRILYAISAWGGFLNATETGRFNAFLARTKKFGYCSKKTTFEDLLTKADHRLFGKAQSTNHCLNHLLPEIRNTTHVLRERGHPFTLPHCSYNLFKRSFITRVLFEQMNS
jgi:hypothetical protein